MSITLQHNETTALPGDAMNLPRLGYGYDEELLFDAARIRVIAEPLKPCPFCGNIEGNGMGIRAGTDKVYCQCGALKPVHGWNARPLEDAMNAEIARLRKVLQEWQE